MIRTNKSCYKCQIEKPIMEFHKDKTKNDGYAFICKICKLQYAKIRCQNKKEQIKAYKKTYRQENKQKIKLYNNKWLLNNPNYFKEYNQNNNEKIKFNSKEWRKNNQEKIKIYWINHFNFNKEKIYSYRKNKRLIDINYKISCNLRTRLWFALKDKVKKSSAVKDLGCSIKDLKIFIENKFTNGMSWENYGKEWHIDHIIPCTKFDLLKTEEQKKCFNYNNLQPLWAIDNWKKNKHEN